MRFDTHVHLSDAQFDIDRAQILQQADRFLECATSLEDAPQVLALAQANAHVYAAVGIHPGLCPPKEQIASQLQQLFAFAKQAKCVAIGEIGLDYRAGQPDRILQKQLFCEQLELAHALDLPVSIHCVQAAGDLMEILRSRPMGKGFVHGFSMSREVAQVCLDKGYDLGIGASAAYANGRRIREVLAYAPLDRLVLETDSPFMPPSLYKGQRNVPQNLCFAAQAVTEVKGIAIQAVYDSTCQNACEMLGIRC